MTGSCLQTLIWTGCTIVSVLVFFHIWILYKMRSGRLVHNRLFFRRYEVMADAALDPIFIVDRSLRFVAVNASFCRFVGGDKEGLIGKTLSEVWPSSTMEWLTQKISECLQGCALIERQPFQSHSGLSSIYEVSLYPYTPKKVRRTANAVVYLKDISDYLAKEEELEREREKALAASKAKGDFLASMSHEIRTPINAIAGLTELALRQELSGELREDLETVQSVSGTLLAIVNDILDFSRIEAGKLILEHSAFCLPDMLGHVIKAFEPSARAKGIALDLDLDPGLPRNVRGDSLRLGQILYNLIGNAIKFTEKGGVVVSLAAMRSVPADDRLRLCLEVRDTGIGIPKDKIGNIFESFSQADAGTARRYGGSGLGLTISRELARMFGGDLRAESTPGCGSSFIAELCFERAATPETLKPALPFIPSAVSPPSGVDPGLAEHTSTNAESVFLLVEDNEINARVILRQMQLLEMTGDWARDGASALHLLSRRVYLFVFMDIQMPGMDGWETVSRIRGGEAGDAAKKAQIVALTAHASTEIAARCVDSGMVTCLTKPVSLDALRALLPKLIGSQELPLLDLAEPLGRIGGDRALMDEILGIFRTEAPQRVSDALRAFENGHWEELQSLSHKVRGSASSMGAVRLSAAAGDLEKAVKEQERTAMAQAFDTFLKVYALTMETVSHPLDKGRSPQG